MTYEDFRQSIIAEEGDFFDLIVFDFLTQATKFAEAEKYEEAVILANDALVMAKYADVGYRIVYLIGMLCQTYLQNNQPEMADKYFNYAMLILDKNDSGYDEDMNKFLDLKALIERELQKKNEAK